MLPFVVWLQEFKCLTLMCCSFFLDIFEGVWYLNFVSSIPRYRATVIIVKTVFTNWSNNTVWFRNIFQKVSWIGMNFGQNNTMNPIWYVEFHFRVLALNNTAFAMDDCDDVNVVVKNSCKIYWNVKFHSHQSKGKVFFDDCRLFYTRSFSFLRSLLLLLCVNGP